MAQEPSIYASSVSRSWSESEVPLYLTWFVTRPLASSFKVKEIRIYTLLKPVKINSLWHFTEP
jgi:hypothetical protein